MVKILNEMFSPSYPSRMSFLEMYSYLRALYKRRDFEIMELGKDKNVLCLKHSISYFFYLISRTRGLQRAGLHLHADRGRHVARPVLRQAPHQRPHPGGRLQRRLDLRGPRHRRLLLLARLRGLRPLLPQLGGRSTPPKVEVTTAKGQVAHRVRGVEAERKSHALLRT